jgi:eukaryotic-like serine/threonine-protein kinase
MIDQTSYAQWLGAELGEYRLTRLLSTTPMGPLFAAESLNAAGTFLVRALGVPPAQTPDAMQAYQGYLERQAGHILALRHPYMLPLVSYGLYQGVPYLVWPYTTMRSLSTRLSQSGLLDVVTMGRYLDQIAAALEYAHQNATYHRNLSVDCIYLQMDGQIAIGDFGVRRLFEMLAPTGQAGFFYGSLEAQAPEQLTGGVINSYTDVYALGAVTFRMLTGRPVFSGESYREVAEQHLQAPPPLLNHARPGLPLALDRAVANALAKDPTQRIQHPGTFADMYQRVVAPANSLRVPFDAPGGTATASPSLASHAPLTPVAPSSMPGRRASVASAPAMPRYYGRGNRSFFSRNWWFLLIVLVILPLLSVGGFYLVNRHNAVTSGATLFFVDSSAPPDGSNNGLRFTMQGIAAPPKGSRYEAWLVNRQTEQIIALGTLTAGEDGSYQLIYTSTPSNGKPGVNVLAQGDMVEITEEKSNVAAPAGRVVVSVNFPSESFVHIKHLLLAYPTTPGEIGLLVGVLQQTRLLNEQATALNQASGTGQSVLINCLAQSIIDISEGEHGAHYRPLDSGCKALGVTQTGDGFGLLTPKDTGSSYSGEETPGYIKNAADHASLAVGTPDATDALRQHATPVETALSDVTKSVTAVDNAALTLLTKPNNAQAVATLVAASAAAYQGAGGSGTGGAISAYQQGQLMATLQLTPAAGA